MGYKDLAMATSRENFIRKHHALFWYTPEDAKLDVSDELLAETVLNYGTLDDFRELVNVMTPKRLSQVFFSAVCRKADILPKSGTFFSLLLKKYA